MRPNPWSDAAHFLVQPHWFTPVYWLLLLGSIVIALLVWRTNPEQRSLRALGHWVLRFLVGTMWWQQSLWKIPPNYGGLRYWMQQEAAHAAIALQGWLVSTIVLPHLAVFGPLVYAIEVAIGASLILGLLSRWGAALGVLMAINLWLGLYSAPGEWPWTYMFLVIIQLLYVIDPPGRMLGADALLSEGAGNGRRRRPRR
jgi:uncharacterized membrane protein YphA (DoxX/SURF4 family)